MLVVETINRFVDDIEAKLESLKTDFEILLYYKQDFTKAMALKSNVTGPRCTNIYINENATIFRK